MARDPDAVLLADCSAESQPPLTYGGAAAKSDAAAVRLGELGVAIGDTVAVVGRAGVGQAILKIACLKLGAVLAPLSSALVSSSPGRRKLVAMLSIARPKLLVSAGVEKARLLELEAKPEAPTLAVRELLDADNNRSVSAGVNEQRLKRRAFKPTDPAATFFTSGSTGDPKGVSITRGMIASNQCACALHWPFLARQRPVLIDWLPWHHVFGGLDNFFKVLWHGGEYHVEPPPDPQRLGSMAERIRKIRPSLHINVPYGIGLLLDLLERDPITRDAFFSRMELIFFAGAGIDAKTWSRLKAIVGDVRSGSDEGPTVLSGYGSTEAASTICLGHEVANQTTEIGLPIPGHELRLVPVDGSFEVRVRGPNVAPAYVDAKGKRPVPLDSQGFLLTGDSVKAVHDGEPERGLKFDGRLAEDFKLNNGTRVKVGALRRMLIETCAPYLADVAIAGEGQAYVAAILFGSGEAEAGASTSEVAANLHRALSRHNERLPGSSTAIRRAVIANRPPDPDAGEINDKGHLVQRRCLKNRRDLVAQLYGDPPVNEVLLLDHPDNPTPRSDSNA